MSLPKTALDRAACSACSWILEYPSLLLAMAVGAKLALSTTDDAYILHRTANL